MPQSEIPYRPLGRTGEQVSIMGLGGFHLGMPEEKEAIKIVRTAVDNGINFMDNCWDYMAGKSEIRMGKALRDGYRQKVFLMTKIDAHTGRAAVQQLEESLKRLQTDSVDLLQFHEVIRITDPEQIFSPGGSLEALLTAMQVAFNVKAVSEFPSVLEDIAVIVDEGLPADRVEALIRQTGGKLLASVRLFDVFRSEQIGAGKKSLAYALAYQSPDSTLTEKESNQIRNRIIQRLDRELGAKLRS